MRNLKRALSLGLTAAMISGLMVMGSSAASYADVADTDNVEAIEVLQAVGIMVGDNNGEFNPDQNVTRNEMAVVMSNLMEYNVASYKDTSPFTDVPSWAEPYVAACWTNGITAGTSATTYGGSDNVTTSQAALMLMKALGYFQYSQDFGQDWQLATATKGNDIDLFNGVDSGLREAMTRNDLAQLVLNTLESGTVQASTSGSITVGGVTIATDVQYNYVTSNAGYARSISTEKSTTNTTDAQSSIVELGEDLYQGDLTKTKDHDAFGRPAAIWAYKDNEIGTYVDDRTQTWTTKVTERDLYRAAGTAAVNDYTWTYWIDGERHTMDGSALDRNDTDRWQTTGNGVLTEMFVDTVAETVDVTVIHTYVAEVSRVEANEDDNDYTVTVNLKTRPAGVGVNREFSTETEFARGDIVVVNIADGSIETMTLAETVEGTVSAVKDNDYLKIDGNPYNYNYAYTTDAVLQGYTSENKGLYDLENSTPANPGAGDEVVLYLDTNGCLVAVAEAGEVAEDYIYVKGLHQAYGDYSAKIVKYDGTEETVDIDDVDGTAVTAGEYKQSSNYTALGELGLGVYKYSRSGNAYDLTSSYYDTDKNTAGPQPEFTKAELVNVKIENGRARIYEEGIGGTATYAVDSNTVFVDAYNNTAYVGYNNVPTMSGVQGWVLAEGETPIAQAVADVVFITNNVAYEVDNDNFFLVTSAGAEEEYNENGNTWNYTVWIEGDETTITSASELDLEVGVYKITKTNSDGHVTKVEQVVTEAEILNNYGSTSNAYAIYASGSGLTVAYPANSDKSVDVGETPNNRFTITDSDSLIMVAYLNDDNDDVDTVTVGDLGDINVVDANNPQDSETSAVYVLNVDDVDKDSPIAKLVLVINPDPTNDNAGGAIPAGMSVIVDEDNGNVDVYNPNDTGLNGILKGVVAQLTNLGYTDIAQSSGGNAAAPVGASYMNVTAKQGNATYNFTVYNAACVMQGRSVVGYVHTGSTIALSGLAANAAYIDGDVAAAADLLFNTTATTHTWTVAAGDLNDKVVNLKQAVQATTGTATVNGGAVANTNYVAVGTALTITDASVTAGNRIEVVATADNDVLAAGNDGATSMSWTVGDEDFTIQTAATPAATQTLSLPTGVSATWGAGTGYTAGSIAAGQSGQAPVGATINLSGLATKSYLQVNASASPTYVRDGGTESFTMPNSALTISGDKYYKVTLTGTAGGSSANLNGGSVTVTCPELTGYVKAGTFNVTFAGSAETPTGNVTLVFSGNGALSSQYNTATQILDNSAAGNAQSIAPDVITINEDVAADITISYDVANGI